MKRLLMILMLLPTMISAADIPYVAERPKVLHIKLVRSRVTDKFEVKHVENSSLGRSVVTLEAQNESIKDFYKTLLDEEILELYCDGDYFLAHNNFGRQVVSVNSLNLCVDADGEEVAHSAGRSKLNAKEMAASKKFLSEHMTKKEDKAVNDSSKPKDVPKEGVAVFKKKKKPEESDTKEM